MPPAEVVAATTQILDGVDLPGRLVPPANWHVTLRFAGAIDEVAWDRWVHELDGAVDLPRLRMRLRALGAFPHARRATVLWVGVEAPGIEELAERVEEAAVAAGLKPEERPFRPHLTVARIRPPQRVSRLLEETESLDVRWDAEEYHLMAGVGNRYRTFASFPLGSIGK